MLTWRLVLAFSLMIFGRAYAQEQMALRINEKGIIKILQFGLQYNTSSKTSRTVVIPQNIYKFTIPKSKIHSNPIVPIVNELSDLNLNKDLDFYLNTSDIKISGDVNPKSLKTSIFNSKENGFDFRLSLAIPFLSIEGRELSLCENKQRNYKRCGDGLKATLNNLKMSTSTRPVQLSVVLRLRTDGKVARVSVISVDSNLEDKTAPHLNINFKSIDIPRIAIVINNQETELDTSRLKSEILNRKVFLGKKLLSFAGEFIANDLAEMLNVYLINEEVATSYQIFRRDREEVKFDDYIGRNLGVLSFNNSFTYKSPFEGLPVQKTDPMSVIMAQISRIVRTAQVDISLKKITTPINKDIELSGLLNFILNNKEINVKNTLGNSHRPLPKLNLDSYRQSDINLAISEPLINGALDLANSTKLFQSVFETISPVKGFSIRNIKIHFKGDKNVVAVVNAQVDLKKIDSNGIGSWFKNRIAAWLERNNNNAVIYFPIEVNVVPEFKKLSSGGMGLNLKVISPFNNLELPNTYNYPTNVPQMTETVKEGVMEELRESLEPHTNKTYSVDLSAFLNQSGVVFRPQSISINQAAYLLINLDLVDIKFNSKNPNLR